MAVQKVVVLDEDGKIPLEELPEGLGGTFSIPPSGCHKIYNIYLKKVGDVYRIEVEMESEPEP